ncbi:MAG: peptide chain release factor 2 [Clostridiales bacterium]|nr:peptide chain release factor 2 [Clostridiales bacterium]
MLALEQMKPELLALKEQIVKMGDSLDLPTVEMEIEELENKAAEPGFWDDPEKSQVVLQRTKALRTKHERYKKLVSAAEDLAVLVQLGIEEQEESVVDEAKQELERVRAEYSAMNLQTLLVGEFDKNNAILTMHAGSGGTESQDWVEMLLRMYMRWAEAKGFSPKVVDILDGEEAGIKSVSVIVTGENAYGFLKSENGVHRLVRISPFDAAGRRHTSFASVEIMPELDDGIVIDINPDDLKTDTFRSSGAGGQHINKTDSAVRITHIPTGIVVACQTERSQFQNRDNAMKMLRSKLYELKQKEHAERIEDIKGVQMDIAWGSQIRSYVFCPYTMVKDHRTEHEEGAVDKVMDGGLDGFINAYLVSEAQNAEAARRAAQ